MAEFRLQTECPIEKLPNELLEMIINNLDMPTCLNVRATSKWFQYNAQKKFVQHILSCTEKFENVSMEEQHLSRLGTITSIPGVSPLIKHLGLHICLRSFGHSLDVSLHQPSFTVLKDSLRTGNPAVSHLRSLCVSSTRLLKIARSILRVEETCDSQTRNQKMQVQKELLRDALSRLPDLQHISLGYAARSQDAWAVEGCLVNSSRGKRMPTYSYGTNAPGCLSDDCLLDEVAMESSSISGMIALEALLAAEKRPESLFLGAALESFKETPISLCVLREVNTCSLKTAFTGIRSLDLLFTEKRFRSCLSWTGISHAAHPHVLSGFIARFPDLERLCLSGSSHCISHPNVVAQALLKLRPNTLKRLELRNVTLTGKDFEDFLKAQSGSLCHLSILQCYMADDCGKEWWTVILRRLQTNDILQSLEVVKLWCITDSQLANVRNLYCFGEPAEFSFAQDRVSVGGDMDVFRETTQFLAIKMRYGILQDVNVIREPRFKSERLLAVVNGHGWQSTLTGSTYPLQMSDILYEGRDEPGEIVRLWTLSYFRFNHKLSWRKDWFSRGWTLRVWESNEDEEQAEDNDEP